MEMSLVKKVYSCCRSAKKTEKKMGKDEKERRVEKGVRYNKEAKGKQGMDTFVSTTFSCTFFFSFSLSCLSERTNIEEKG